MSGRIILLGCLLAKSATIFCVCTGISLWMYIKAKQVSLPWPMVERNYVLRSRRVHILLSHSQLVTGNTAEMRKIVATLLKNSSSHSLRVAVMVQGLFSGSLDCQREYHWANSACKVSLHGKSVSKKEKSSNFGNIVTVSGAGTTYPSEAPVFIPGF